MRAEFFTQQIKRLQTRFTPKALDEAFVDLVWKEVHDMSEPGFGRTCDVFIGSRPPNKPPLLVEFREARIAEHKARFNEDVNGAAKKLFGDKAEADAHLLKILRQEYGHVNSVMEALEIAKIRYRASEAGK